VVRPSPAPGPAPRDNAASQPEACDDFVAARTERLARVGGVLPPLAAIGTLFVLRVTGGGASQLAVAVGGFAVLGQAMVWLGMHGLWRTHGWASGVMPYLVIGGVLSAQTLFLTGIPEVMPIPLLAPLVATFARWRMHRRARSAGVPR
jgi:hypothetical protein